MILTGGVVKLFFSLFFFLCRAILFFPAGEESIVMKKTVL